MAKFPTVRRLSLLLFALGSADGFGGGVGRVTGRTSRLDVGNGVGSGSGRARRRSAGLDLPSGSHDLGGMSDRDGRRGRALRALENANVPPLGALLDKLEAFKSPFASIEPPSASSDGGERTVRSFLAALNSRSDPSMIAETYFDDDAVLIDGSYYNAMVGKEEIKSHFYLHAGSSALSTFGDDSAKVVVVDDVVSAGIPKAPSDAEEEADGEALSKVCVRYHLATMGGEDVPDSMAITFYHLSNDKIKKIFDVTEPPSPKPGDGGLKLLKIVSRLIGDEDVKKGASEVSGEAKGNNDGSTLIVEQYFQAWNRRDMSYAASLFSEDCQMRDLQYPESFVGKEAFERHLKRVEECLPPSFDFVVDDIVSSRTKAGVLWHVENDGDALAFTRGCSFYTLNNYGWIETGFEIPEKAPPKLGWWRTFSCKFRQEPARYIPAFVWIAYNYIVFFSDGILPGANALQLELRTWEEVRDLSLNFFLVAPALDLPFSPSVHPMLEGVFNLLLAWAAMFAGFLSDEREDKPNLMPFGPTLVGMQFLTSAFLLPYLFLRTSEPRGDVTEGRKVVYVEDIDGAVRIAEWRPLGLALGGVGIASILWALFARQEEFGADFGGRCASFADLLSVDRVGSSFLVDLTIFALFQGWFVDDDLRRRGILIEEGVVVGEGESNNLEVLRNVAKYVPFLGLAAYLTLRPTLPHRSDG